MGSIKPITMPTLISANPDLCQLYLHDCFAFYLFVLLPDPLSKLAESMAKASGWTIVYQHSYIDENGKYYCRMQGRNDGMLKLSDKLRFFFLILCYFNSFLHIIIIKINFSVFGIL